MSTKKNGPDPLRPQGPVYVNWTRWFALLDQYAQEVHHAGITEEINALNDSGAARLHLHAQGVDLSPTASARGGRQSAWLSPDWSRGVPGGRVYSSDPNVQGLPKALRPAFYYPGRMLACLDLRSAHPRLLGLAYAQASGKPSRLLQDLDACDIYGLLRGDLGLPEDFRPYVKRGVVALLNGMSKDTPPASRGFPPDFPIGDLHRACHERWGPELAFLRDLARTLPKPRDNDDRFFRVLEKWEAHVMSAITEALKERGFGLYIPMHDGAVYVAPAGAEPGGIEDHVRAVVDDVLGTAEAAIPAWTLAVGSAWGVDDQALGPVEVRTLDDWVRSPLDGEDFSPADAVVAAARGRASPEMELWLRSRPYSVRALASLRPGLFVRSRRVVWTEVLAPALEKAGADLESVRDRPSEAACLVPPPPGRKESPQAFYLRHVQSFLIRLVQEHRIVPWVNKRARTIAFDMVKPDGSARTLQFADGLQVIQSLWGSSAEKRETREQLREEVFIREIREEAQPSPDALIRVRDPLEEWRKVLPEWDGTPRLREWLPRALRADPQKDGRIVPVIGRLGEAWFLSMAARVLRPGVMVEGTLVLRSGLSGICKTTLFHEIVPDPETWLVSGVTFASIVSSARDVLGPLIRTGGGVLLFDDIEDIPKREDGGRLKAFLTQTHDGWRWAYDRAEGVFPRSWVCAGTSNSDRVLPNEDAFRRRLWVVDMDQLACWRAELESNTGLRIDLDYVRDNREQLWAEALAVAQEILDAQDRRETPARTWWLSNDERQALALYQQDVTRVDPKADLVLCAAAVGWHGRRHRLGRRGDQAAISAYQIEAATGVKSAHVEHLLLEAGWTVAKNQPRSAGTKKFLPPRGDVTQYFSASAMIDLLSAAAARQGKMPPNGGPRLIRWVPSVISSVAKDLDWTREEIGEITSLLQEVLGITLVLDRKEVDDLTS